MDCQSGTSISGHPAANAALSQALPIQSNLQKLILKYVAYYAP
jgi:hypothetical protein